VVAASPVEPGASLAFPARPGLANASLEFKVYAHGTTSSSSSSGGSSGGSGGGLGPAGPPGYSGRFRFERPPSGGGAKAAAPPLLPCRDETPGAPPAAAEFVPAYAGAPPALVLSHPSPRAACVTGYKITVLSPDGSPLEALTLPTPFPTAPRSWLALPAGGRAAAALGAPGGAALSVAALNGVTPGPAVTIPAASVRRGPSGPPPAPAPLPGYGLGGRADSVYAELGGLYGPGPSLAAAGGGSARAACKAGGGAGASLC
jgi:hypothetical protein